MNWPLFGIGLGGLIFSLAFWLPHDGEIKGRVQTYLAVVTIACIFLMVFSKF